MEELTDVDTLIETICHDCPYKCNEFCREVKHIIKTRTVDAVHVVHGHWLKATGMMPPEWFGRHVCSICDNFAPNEFHGTHEWLSPICPNCGAKMDRKDDEQK